MDLVLEQRNHLVDVEARVFWFVPVTPKELMHFCVINEAIIVLIVVTVVSAGITFPFLNDIKTKQHQNAHPSRVEPSD